MCVSLQGPIKVTVQELDGSFNHMLQIEENSLKHDIPCHSKSRRYDGEWDSLPRSLSQQGNIIITLQIYFAIFLHYLLDSYFFSFLEVCDFF